MYALFRVVLALFMVASGAENPWHYGDPVGGCRPDEQGVQGPGVGGELCAPLCIGPYYNCPTDFPPGVPVETSSACIIGGTSDGWNCALFCVMGSPCSCGADNCAVCNKVDIPGMPAGTNGVCSYYDDDENCPSGLCGLSLSSTPSSAPSQMASTSGALLQMASASGAPSLTAMSSLSASSTFSVSSIPSAAPTTSQPSSTTALAIAGWVIAGSLGCAFAGNAIRLRVLTAAAIPCRDGSFAATGMVALAPRPVVVSVNNNDYAVLESGR